MTPSAEFERRIERIHSLLEREAIVTWNDRIPDPDNPSQPRQIDITIRRDGALTLVECRIHKDPQDFTWIEELIGRRASLRAKAVIAVSASGFTQGAQAKAQRFGIFLRDLLSLTTDEVRGWGKKRRIRTRFYKFSRSVVAVTLPLVPTKRPKMTNPKGEPFDWRPMFTQVIQQIEERRLLVLSDGRSLPVTLLDIKAACLFDGMKPIHIGFSSDIRMFTQQVWTTSVLAYADPAHPGDLVHAEVGGLDLGKSEILETLGGASAMIDLTGIRVPRSCIFTGLDFAFDKPVALREMRLIGHPAMLRVPIPTEFQYTVPRT